MYSETASDLESIIDISCVFLNPSDTSDKICCVIYQLCDQKAPIEDAPECSRKSPYNIQLEVSGHDHSRQRYCYTVTASNDTYTIRVDGTFITGDNNRGGNTNTAAAIAGGVLITFLLLLLLGAIALTIIIVKKKQQSQKCGDKVILKPHLIHYHRPNTLTLHCVDRDCALQEFITGTLSAEFKKGHTYYEFTNEVENILEGKEVLLQDKKNTKKWFRLAPPEKVTVGRLKLYGEGIARNYFGHQYRVFIQSFGSGTRYLPRGSSFLYNHCDDQLEPDVIPLVPVCSEHFAHKVIDSVEGLSAQQFCTQNGLNPKAFNLFLTVEHLSEGTRDKLPRDVILMDRVSRQLFTGPFARQLLVQDPKRKGESQNEKEKWKIFVLLKKDKQGLVLNKDSEVLYQDSNYQAGNYTVLDVDVDCVRLSKFIEMELNCQYENGKAFYEVTENEQETEGEDESKREEDLLYCKKILRPTKNELSCKELKLESLIEYFYAIPGVPSMAVKPEQLRLEHHKVFIQSTSQGSRCLKKGEKILYLKEWTGGPESPGDSLSTNAVTAESHSS